MSAQCAARDYIPQDLIDLYNSAVNYGIIDVALLQEQVNMASRKTYLSQHLYSIWEDSNGCWNTYLPCPSGRKRVKKHTRKELDDVIFDYYKEAKENPTFEELYREWIEKKVMFHEIQPNTRDRNDQIFYRHFSEMGKRRINSVTPTKFMDFLCDQVPLYDMTAKGFANLKSICKGFLIRAKRNEIIDWNVAEMFGDIDISRKAFRSPKNEDSEEVFNREETFKIMKYLLSDLDRQNAAILLIFVSGLRCGEVVTLKHEDLGKYSFRVRRTESRVRSDSPKAPVPGPF